MNKTIPAVAAAVLALYLDHAARRRHRAHMQALRQYRTSVTVRDVTMLPRPDTPGPFIRVAGPDDDALTPEAKDRLKSAQWWTVKDADGEDAK